MNAQIQNQLEHFLPEVRFLSVFGSDEADSSLYQHWWNNGLTSSRPAKRGCIIAKPVWIKENILVLDWNAEEMCQEAQSASLWGRWNHSQRQQRKKTGEEFEELNQKTKHD